MAGTPKDILPVGLLMKEHRLIERMVVVIAEKVKAYQGEQKPEPKFVNAVIDFYSVYADENHHGKEEKILFARLADKDMLTKHQTTMETLLNDHVNGRMIIKRMRELISPLQSNNPQALDEIVVNLQTLVDLYSNHIDTEDNHFFLPAMDYFNKSEQEQMVQDFIDFDREIIHNHYRDVVEFYEKGGSDA